MENHDPEFLRQVYVSVWRDRPEAEDLIEKAPLDHVYDNGRQLLHVACWFNRGALASKLLSKKAPVLSEDNFGKTPLALAIENESFSAFKAVLLASPESLFYLSQSDSKKDANKFNPLRLIAEKGLLDFWLFAWAQVVKNETAKNEPVVPTDEQKKLTDEVLQIVRPRLKKPSKWTSAVPKSYVISQK